MGGEEERSEPTKASENHEKDKARYEDKHLMQPIRKGMKAILTTQLSQQVQGKHASDEGEYRRKTLEDGQD